jgi:hypothetical protein
VPDGVANLVLGTGPEAGAGLAEHPAVDLVSFTGSLELGGKNPHIVFADADFGVSVDLALNAAFLHSGQVCSVGTRLLVQTPADEDFVTELARRARAIRLGNGLDPDTESGPLVSATQLAKVERYGRLGVEQGARLLAGGRRPDKPELAQGFFYLPTMFADCTAEMTPVREETFGSIITAAVRHRGRGRRARQRHRVWPGRRRVDAGSRTRRARRAPVAPRHCVDQRLRPVPAVGRMERVQEIRHRPRTRPVGPARVLRGQARVPQSQTGGAELFARSLVAPS